MYLFGLVVLCFTIQQANGRSQVNCCLQHYDFGTGKTLRYESRWWYDIGEGACLAFSYSGYGGNGNNFKTEKECMHMCGVGSHYYTGMGDGYVDDGHYGLDHPESFTGVHHEFDPHGDDHYEQEIHVDYYATSKWTAWSAWGPCTKTCGDGEKRRTRACFNNKHKGYVRCTGSKHDAKPCGHLPYCPVNGGWSDWSHWSHCSVTCGTGTMKKERSCTNPSPSYHGRSCVGRTYITKQCKEEHCPQNGDWSNWSDWGPCSQTCDHGIKRRTRACNSPYPKYGGGDCYGKHEDQDDCYSKPCHYPVDGYLTEWSKWSKCDGPCQNGNERLFKRRYRKCIKPEYGGKPCPKKAKGQKKRCNKFPCLEKACPGGARPYEVYDGFLVCGKSGYNQRCPADFECLPVDGHTYNSKTLSVCCKVEPENACHLPKDSGPCYSGYSSYVYYYYNKETDRCEPFHYGGCGGNSNRFKDPYICQNLCVKKPPSKETCCYDKKYEGDTDGPYCNPHYRFDEWYFDSTTNKCELMHYSGCGGNKNRFYDKFQCEDTCKRQIDTSYKGDKCNLPCDVGVDSGLSELPTMYYYNKDTDTCEKFKYKGAGGNDNSFYDYWVCEEECKKKPPSQQDCYQAYDYGDGSDHLTYYYFDEFLQTCKSFEYSGKGGNKNRFPDKDYCEKVCKNREQGVSVCDLPMDKGDGYGDEERYYYDQSSGKCKTFHYSGHGGNYNCFKLEEECQEQTKVCDKPYTSPAVCELPPDSGYGSKGGYDRYFYDKKSGKCKEFIYFNGGNANNFQTKEQCEKRCADNKHTKYDCLLPAETGPCNSYFQRYYYDDLTKECYKFTFGGCYGNANNFMTKEECKNTCGSYEQPKTVCDLDKDHGIYANYGEEYTYFYYDKSEGICKPFNYRGAHGNGNRFISLDQCVRTCFTEDKKVCGYEPHESGENDKDVDWAYYYNNDDDDCYMFLHTGVIKADENCFPDRKLCIDRCKGYQR